MLRPSVVPWIDVGCCLVDDEYLVSLEDGARQTEQLTLTDAEVLATLVDHALERTCQVLDRTLQLHLTTSHNTPQLQHW